jgi:hypothetical protein
VLKCRRVTLSQHRGDEVYRRPKPSDLRNCQAKKGGKIRGNQCQNRWRFEGRQGRSSMTSIVPVTGLQNDTSHRAHQHITWTNITYITSKCMRIDIDALYSAINQILRLYYSHYSPYSRSFLPIIVIRSSSSPLPIPIPHPPVKNPISQ